MRLMQVIFIAGGQLTNESKFPEICSEKGKVEKMENWKEKINSTKQLVTRQGCISCGILVSGIRARGVSSEHMENMEMFSCSPT